MALCKTVRLCDFISSFVLRSKTYPCLAVKRTAVLNGVGFRVNPKHCCWTSNILGAPSPISLSTVFAQATYVNGFLEFVIQSTKVHLLTARCRSCIRFSAIFVCTQDRRFYINVDLSLPVFTILFKWRSARHEQHSMVFSYTFVWSAVEYGGGNQWSLSAACGSL